MLVFVNLDKNGALLPELGFWNVFTVVVYFSSPPSVVWQTRLDGVKLRGGETKVHNHGNFIFWKQVKTKVAFDEFRTDLKFR